MLRTIQLRSVNVITSGLTGSLSENTLSGNSRNISVPFNLQFNNADQGELIDSNLPLLSVSTDVQLNGSAPGLLMKVIYTSLIGLFK